MRSISLSISLWGFFTISYTDAWMIPNSKFSPISKFQRTQESALYYVNEKSTDNVGTRVGEVLLDGKYMLTGYIPVPSLKCEIYKAYPLNTYGQIQRNQPLIVKFSDSNVDLEYINYQRLSSCITAEQENLFVKIHDHIPGTVLPVNEWGQAIIDETTRTPMIHNSDDPRPPGIVMERGYDNLRVFLKKYGPYKGDALKLALYTVISTVHALHSNNFIWTELKPENFVVTPTGIKGIDLESIVPTHELLQVYTAEACPPEFPLDEMYITLPEMAVTEAFDMWGLGLVLFEIVTGSSFYAGGMTDLEYIKRQLRYANRTVLQAHAKLQQKKIDPKVIAMIMACLQVNPQKRPSCQQLLSCDYFRSTTSATTATPTPTHPRQTSPTKQSSSTRRSSTTTTPYHYYQSSIAARRQQQQLTNSARSRIGPESYVTRLRGGSTSSSSFIAAKEQLVQKVHSSKKRTMDPSLSSKLPTTMGNSIMEQQGPIKMSSQTITVNAQVRTFVPPPPSSSHTDTKEQQEVMVVPSPPQTMTTSATVKLTPTSLSSRKPKGEKTLYHVLQSKATTTRDVVGSGASSTTISSSKEDHHHQQRLDWKKQLTHVLDTLAIHAKEDPEMAYDLISILDKAKEQVLPTPTPTLGY